MTQSPLVNNSKSIAVHFVLEYETPNLKDQYFEIIDTYLVLPSHTLISALIPEVLNKLGLAQDSRISGCRTFACYVLMRNWKPLLVEQICDIYETTLNQLVGDFPNFVILKIRFLRHPSPNEQVKNHVLSLLSEAQSLIRSGNLISNEKSCSCSRLQFPMNQSPSANERCTDCNLSDAINLSVRDVHNSNQQDYTNDSPHHDDYSHQSFTNINTPEMKQLTIAEETNDSRATFDPNSFTKRSRERTTFDPYTEVPILMRTFNETRHPSREEIERILLELNSHPFRQGKKPLEIYNIQYWFKNARAMQKRSKVNSSKLEEDNGTALAQPQVDEQPENSIMECENEKDLSDTWQTNSNCMPVIKSEFMLDVPNEPTAIKSCSSDEGVLIDESFDTKNMSNYNYKMDRKFRRNRVFINPASEVPILEKWYSYETHPDALLINKICKELNDGAYRAQYEKLKPRNIQLWFKNHRAKLKRVKQERSPSQHSV